MAGKLCQFFPKPFNYFRSLEQILKWFVMYILYHVFFFSLQIYCFLFSFPLVSWFCRSHMYSFKERKTTLPSWWKSAWGFGIHSTAWLTFYWAGKKSGKFHHFTIKTLLVQKSWDQGGLHIFLLFKQANKIGRHHITICFCF